MEQREMLIRPFQKGDEQAVSEVICVTLSESKRKDYPPEFIQANIESHSPEVIARRAAESHFFVAAEGERIVGCGGITGYWGSTDESYILSVFVLPSYQGKGLGRRILQTLEADEYFLRAWRTEIGASLTAVPFYQKMGYTFKNGISTPDEDGVVRMEKRNPNAKQPPEKRGCFGNALKVMLMTVGCVAVAAALILGTFVYKIRYEKKEILRETAEDGATVLLIQSVGEPEFPFGAAHGRFVLSKGGKRIAEMPFEVHADGGPANPEHFFVTWLEDRVRVIVSAEEQPAMLYMLCFDGTVVPAQELKIVSPMEEPHEPTGDSIRTYESE